MLTSILRRKTTGKGTDVPSLRCGRATLLERKRWSHLFDLREQRYILLMMLKWALLGGVSGALAGTASALFLAALAWATGARETHSWLLWLLPFAGLAMGYSYQRWGAGAERGNNLILANIHADGGRVPLRMAPMVLVSTVATHLFGGSAGREGTAVQMGGSLAAALSRALRLSDADRRLLLMSGISGGFGSVFGTPLAGTIFGMEVLQIGTVRYAGLVACLAAAFTGDWVTTAWSIGHSQFAVAHVPAFSPLAFGQTAILALAFGLAGGLFARLTDALKALYRAVLPAAAWRAFAGGLVVIGLTYLVGTRAYLGLSLPLIADAFTGAAAPAAFLLKIIFTAVTLGAGFQGGEVTPLFVIGATLGSTLGGVVGLPVDLTAAMGFVAVFAAAANTPLACAVMAVELFGGAVFPYTTVACLLAYLFSGHGGIYGAQRIGTPKHPFPWVKENETLEEIER